MAATASPSLPTSRQTGPSIYTDLMRQVKGAGLLELVPEVAPARADIR